MPGFAARGGWWVVAQVPLLAVAVVLPLWTARGGFGHPLQWLGFALTAGGLLLALAALPALGRALTPFTRPRENAQLRTHGIYRWVRHPIYVGLIVAALGWALAWLSVSGCAFAADTPGAVDRGGRPSRRPPRQPGA